MSVAAQDSGNDNSIGSNIFNGRSDLGREFRWLKSSYKAQKQVLNRMTQ